MKTLFSLLAALCFLNSSTTFANEDLSLETSLNLKEIIVKILNNEKSEEEDLIPLKNIANTNHENLPEILVLANWLFSEKNLDCSSTSVVQIKNTLNSVSIFANDYRITIECNPSKPAELLQISSF